MNPRQPTPAEVLPGTVIELAEGGWKYGVGPLWLRVEHVRWELAQYYDGEVWVHGYRLDEAHVPIDWATALVPISAVVRGSQ